MKLENLKPAEGSVKGRKRIGRGQGSGRGGTSTRGHNGAQSRSGYSKKTGFEGGQMPLQRRVPKFGFKNPFRKEYKVINLDDIQKYIENKKIKELTPEFLQANGWSSKKEKIKVLARGELKTSISIKVHKFSKKAQELVEKAGGTIESIEKN